MIMALRKLLIMFFASLLFACHGGAGFKKPEAKTYVVREETMHKVMYFTGSVQPLREYTVTSPMEAVIETMHVHFGQEVKKDQIVFTLSSAELQKHYNETLTEYLKAKDNFSLARSKFIGTEDLWQAGLLSKNNYKSEQSSLNTSRVTLMQVARRLSEMLEKMGDAHYQDLSKLSFSEFDKVRSALNGQHNIIKLKAPGDGILLYPPKTNDDKAGRLTVGSTVKAMQVLAVVGDLSGIVLEIDVPEVEIDKVKRGMDATIRGVAFAKEELKGKVVAVNAQASSSSAGSLPSFNAVVEVTGLSKQQASIVKVGMSASIELAIDSHQQLLVPIAALIQKRGQIYVRVQGLEGKAVERTVVTGAARADKVVIESGLKAGEVVLYD